MLPAVFGANIWDSMLLCAMSYPDVPNEAQKDAMTKMLVNLMKVLPCNACGLHAIEYVTKNPPNINSRNELITWNVAFHNVVNQRLKKPTFTVEEAIGSISSRAAARYLAQHTQNKQLINQALNGNNIPNVNTNAAAASSTSNETLYFSLMIVMSILAGLFLITLIVLAIQKRRLQSKLKVQEEDT